MAAAIERLAAAAKAVSGGKCWVGAFSGYLYNSANVLPFSGHLGLPRLMNSSHLDAVGLVARSHRRFRIEAPNSF